MAQAHVNKMDPKMKFPCVVCSASKPSWDTHPNCFNCRTCNKTEPCEICSSWDKRIWSKLTRQKRAYERKHFQADADPDGNNSAASKRSSEASDLDEISQEEGGPSIPKSPKQHEGTFNWEKLSGIIKTTVRETVTLSSQDNAKDMAAISSRMDVMAKFMEKRRKGTGRGKKTPVPNPPVQPNPPQITPPVGKPKETTKLIVETMDLSYDAGSGSDLNADLEEGSSSDTNTIVPSEPHDPSPYTNELVNVIYQMGNLKVEHTLDADGFVCIDIPERIKAIATLAQVQTITQVSEVRVAQSFKCKLLKQGVAPSKLLLLPLSPLLESATNAIIEGVAGVKTSNITVLPKAPKNPTVAITNDWWEPGTPSLDYAILGKLPSPDQTTKATVSIKLSTLAEWERAIRQLMTALSYSHHSSTAMCELIQAISYPEQHVASVQALASSFLVLDAGFQTTMLTNAAFMLGSINLTRRDFYIQSLYNRSRAVPKLIRMLRFAPIASDTIFGEAEDNAIQLLHSFNQKQANANLAKGADSEKASSSRSSRTRSRSRNRSDKRERSVSRPRSEKTLLVDVPKHASRQVKFDTPNKNKDSTPFRGGRRGSSSRGGRGGKSGGGRGYGRPSSS